MKNSEIEKITKIVVKETAKVFSEAIPEMIIKAYHFGRKDERRRHGNP